jgi:hypothetical protein
MSRNRKRGQLRVGTVAKTVFVCVLVAVAGLGYVWETNQSHRLGQEIKAREDYLLKLTRRTETLQTHLAFLETPGQLELRVKQYGLNLVAPAEGQIIRMYEPGAEWDLPVRQTAPQSTPSMVARR